ncbi:MAG: HAD family hydrolase [Planctomycetota bacterium]
MKKRRIVFLDRDGTLNIDTGYISKPEELELLPKAVEGLKLLRPRYAVAVVTNQSGVSRGLYSRADVEAVNARLVQLLAEKGVGFDHIEYCPHQKADECDCRKPQSGLLHKAAAALGLGLEGAWMVGDRSTDIETGEAVGARTILLPEPPDAPPLVLEPDFLAEDLLEAARIILREDGLAE